MFLYHGYGKEMLLFFFFVHCLNSSSRWHSNTTDKRFYERLFKKPFDMQLNIQCKKSKLRLKVMVILCNVCNYILTHSHWFPHFIFCPDGGIWLFVCGLFSHQCSLRETLQQKTHHQVLCSFCSLLILFSWHISMQCILI